MPKINSLETLTAIKANPAQVAAAYKHGISGYIQKPVTTAHMEQIAQAIKICLLNATGK